MEIIPYMYFEERYPGAPCIRLRYKLNLGSVTSERLANLLRTFFPREEYHNNVFNHKGRYHLSDPIDGNDFHNALNYAYHMNNFDYWEELLFDLDIKKKHQDLFYKLSKNWFMKGVQVKFTEDNFDIRVPNRLSADLHFNY